MRKMQKKKRSSFSVTSQPSPPGNEDLNAAEQRENEVGLLAMEMEEEDKLELLPKTSKLNYDHVPVLQRVFLTRTNGTTVFAKCEDLIDEEVLHVLEAIREKKRLSLQDMEEYDTDLEDDERTSTRNFNRSRMSPQQMYLIACKDLGIVPVQYFIRNMHEEEVNMAHHSLGVEGIRAMAISLVPNTWITRLNLEDNDFGGEGAVSIADVLSENYFITECNIANNKIGSIGAMAMGKVIHETDTLVKLNLSGNGFTDNDSRFFGKGIEDNSSLRVLNLSHNGFSSIAAEVFGNAIAENIALEELDLSWNHFSAPLANKLLKGVQQNLKLLKLNLSWNGFADLGCPALLKCLTENNTLTHLNLSMNRITDEGAVIFAPALLANDTLRELRLAKNPIGPKGAMALLTAVDNPHSVLEVLDMVGVAVSPEFDALLIRIRNRRDIEVTYTGLKKEVIDQAQPKEEGDKKSRKISFSTSHAAVEMVYSATTPMGILKEHIKRNNISVAEMFYPYDKKKTFKLTPRDFTAAVMGTRIRLSERQLEEIMRLLDSGGKDDLINYKPLIKYKL